MRGRRLKISSERAPGYYHCLSRVVDRRHVFGPQEKERFVRLMRECERFCRVRILTFAVMANHFHILLEVPQRPQSLPGPEQVLQDLRGLSGYQFPGLVRQKFEALREAKDTIGLASYLSTFHARMYDVSAFMKLLKQRFSQWYNGRHKRKGTLWEERFRSVLVDGAGDALTTMAAYIDLNPVRAGLAKDPKDYRWCGYAEAVAGERPAIEGLQTLGRALGPGRKASIPSALRLYRLFLHLEGDIRREGTTPNGQPARRGFSRAEVVEVLNRKGQLPTSEYLRCRVRYFCDGAALGRREFVESVFRDHRDRFSAKRKSGARRLKGLSDPPLFCLRDLRLRVFD